MPFRNHSDTRPAKSSRRHIAKTIMRLLPLLVLLLVSCKTSKRSLFYQSSLGLPRDRFSSTARDGMIASAHPLASRAGLEMLEKGGNAIDAAVAASFVISVVRPQSTGIGGGGFMIYYKAKQKTSTVLDFRERAPSAATTDMFLDSKTSMPRTFRYNEELIPNASVNGHLSVGVPGLVAGLLEAHSSNGTLSLKEVLAPAIEIAQKGFTVYPALENAIKKRESIIRHFPASRKIFLRDGKPIKTGQNLIQKDLAKTLQLISEHGREGFYEGETARLIVKEMKNHGILSLDDLSTYQVRQRMPIEGTYRGHKIISMPPPSSGGVHIIQMLNILETDYFKNLNVDSAERLHFLAETMRRAYVDRSVYLGDPDFVDVPSRGLTSTSYASELRKSINLKKATPSNQLSAGNPLPHESPSTTHISVIDRDGNAVSTTQTINYILGSCVVADGTGIVLNDQMDDFAIKAGSPNQFGLTGGLSNKVAAKKTMLSSMSPSLVFSPDGSLRLVVGSPGGSQIITATLQAILNVIDFNMPLQDAVHRFRIHHQWHPDEIRIEENSFPDETISALKSMGHRVKAYERYLGDVQAIAVEHGVLIGVSDTRSDGIPMGLNLISR